MAGERTRVRPRLGIKQILNQLTVMCTTRGERRLISIQCQNEFYVESKLVISSRMMHHLIKIYNVVGSRVMSIFTNW